MIQPIKIILAGVNQYGSTFNGAIKDIDFLGKKAKSVGNALTVGLSLPILGLGIASTAFSTELNSAMANVATLIPDNISRINELKSPVQDLAIEAGKSSKDVAEGLYQTVSTFQDSAETTKLLGINTKAAVAGLATVSDAINLTSSVTQVWGDTSAKAVQTAADFAFQTSNLGKTTFPELAASISNVTLPSKQLGVSLNEMFAAMAYSTLITNSTSVSSTQFASALKEILNPSKELTQLMDYLGYKSGPEMIKGLGGVIPTLQKITELSTLADVPLQKFLGRSEAMLFAMQFTGDGVKKFDSILKGMSDTAVAGAADRAFRQQTEGINKTGFALSQALQRLTVFGQKLGDALAPAIDAVIRIGTPLLNWLINLDPTILSVTAAFAGLVALAGPVIVGISSIAAIFVAASLPVVGWVAAIVGGIALVGAAVTLIVVKWNAIKGFFVGVWDFLTKLFNSRIGTIVLYSNIFTALPTLLIKNWDKIKDAFSNGFDSIKKTVAAFSDWFVKSPVYSFFGKVGSWLGGVDNGLKGPLDQLDKSAGSVAGKSLKWLLGNDDGTAFFGTPSGAPAGMALKESIRESRKTEISKSEQKVKVEIAGLPQGTKVSTSGSLKNVDLSMGYQAVSF
jgi:TP901 family phage tail tape measure protein